MDKDDFKMIAKRFLSIKYQERPIHLIYDEREIFVLDPVSGIKIKLLCRQ